jgi:hypothetical protein
MTATLATYQKEIEEVIQKVLKTRSLEMVRALDGTRISGWFLPKTGRVAWSVNDAATGKPLLLGIWSKTKGHHVTCEPGKEVQGKSN